MPLCVSVCACLDDCVCVCMSLCVWVCVRFWVRACVYVHGCVVYQMAMSEVEKMNAGSEGQGVQLVGNGGPC